MFIVKAPELSICTARKRSNTANVTRAGRRKTKVAIITKSGSALPLVANYDVRCPDDLGVAGHVSCTLFSPSQPDGLARSIRIDGIRAAFVFVLRRCIMACLCVYEKDCASH